MLWPEEKKYCGWCVCVSTWYLDAKECDWHYLTCWHLLFAHQVGYPFSILPLHIWGSILAGTILGLPRWIRCSTTRCLWRLCGGDSQILVKCSLIPVEVTCGKETDMGLTLGIGWDICCLRHKIKMLRTSILESSFSWISVFQQKDRPSYLTQQLLFSLPKCSLGGQACVCAPTPSLALSSQQSMHSPLLAPFVVSGMGNPTPAPTIIFNMARLGLLACGEGKALSFLEMLVTWDWQEGVCVPSNCQARATQKALGRLPVRFNCVFSFHCKEDAPSLLNLSVQRINWDLS